MKITTKTAAPEFTPVDITITCESQKEIDALHVLGNHNPTIDSTLRDACDARIGEREFIQGMLKQLYYLTLKLKA